MGKNMGQKFGPNDIFDPVATESLFHPNLDAQSSSIALTTGGAIQIHFHRLRAGEHETQGTGPRLSEIWVVKMVISN